MLPISKVGARAAVAVAAAASFVMAVSACSTPESEATGMQWVNPDANKETSLADGSYVIKTVSFRSYADDECMYGGRAETRDGVEAEDVTIYGRGPTECPNYVGVNVYFNVVDGVEVIEKVTDESPLVSQ